MKMDPCGWTCASHLYALDICLEVHKEYIEAEAELLIANTFATNRVVSNHNGVGGRAVSANSSASGIAKRRCQSLWRK